MSKPLYYECHVTLRPKDAIVADEVARENYFHTSQIARDEVLGNESWFYCTKSSNDWNSLLAAMGKLVNDLNRKGVFPVRMKVESALFDVRFQ